ncbi:hypothetical protein EYF80_037123 [Liparis tanakae]|uniref:Uncharacterized protein n=1 Tax=Liparis tanakae TaxID=230148 RepID=A0A4Z2GIY4_9TELE|nr:hypothetical protein EYF80_037123 [Liparis tanakae]
MGECVGFDTAGPALQLPLGTPRLAFVALTQRLSSEVRRNRKSEVGAAWERHRSASIAFYSNKSDKLLGFAPASEGLLLPKPKLTVKTEVHFEDTVHVMALLMPRPLLLSTSICLMEHGAFRCDTHYRGIHGAAAPLNIFDM